MIKNVEQIKEAAQIEEVVGDFITLTKKGASLMACCPFHGEKTPSFSVSPSRGIFKCFGCGKGGDSVTFLKENGMEYPDALRYIAKKYGITVEEEEGGGRDYEAEKKTQIKATASVLQAFFSMSEKETPGIKYWKTRGFEDATLEEFGVGYCDGSKPAHVPDADLSEVGAINDKGNFSLYKRSTIPLHDAKGNVIGWAGRSIESEEGKEKAKYINSPNTKIYNKSTHLFNLHRASKHIRDSEEVWIVEGYADVMAAWQSGVKNVVGLCGTALTDSHVNQLRRFNGDVPLRIILALDNEIVKTGDDEAGKTYKASVALAYFSAMEKMIPLGETRRFIYPSNKGKRVKDIADLVMAKISPDSCTKKDCIEDYVERKLGEDDWANKASAVQKADFQEHVARLIARIKRDSVRDIYIKKLYELLEITPKKLSELVAKYSDQKEQVAYDILDQEYIIIKDEIRQRYPFFDDKTGEVSWRYQTLKKSTVTDQFGTAFIKTLPRFTKSVIEPGHTNYKRTFQLETELGTYNFFNDYEPLAFKPKEFVLPKGFEADPFGFDYTTIPEIRNIAKLFRHIFENGKNALGDDFLQIAWDWLAIMYLHPKERLPAIGLVSKEEGTGKSTLINVLAKFFGTNTSKIDSSRIAAKFNSLMGGKVLVYCEETKDDRGQMENILKDLITGFEAVIEKKFGDAEVVPTFCKFLFASNHPDTFMKIGSKSTRFFVNEIKPIPEEDKVKVGNFEELCYMEIPYLAYFLNKRGIMISREDRLWFNPQRYENEALKRLQQSSKDNVDRNIEDLMETIFLGLQHTQPILSFTSRELMQMMIAYAGKKYETHTVNYFQDVCVRMGMVYTDTRRRNTIEVKGLYNGGASIVAEPKSANQGRFIEFPIWKFCEAGQVAEMFTPDRLGELIKNLHGLEEKKNGSVPAEWLEDLITESIKYPLKEDIPF